jgi:hypothetical protein
MSELRFSSKKDAVLNIKSFCETLFNAKNHLNYSNQKSDVEKYLKLLDIYSKKIDLDLNNSIMSLRLAIAQNYGNAQCFDIEGMKWIDKWYTNFKNQTEYSIALLPNSQDYQPILDSFGASMEKFNQRVEELEKKYEGLEKKINQPQQLINSEDIYYDLNDNLLLYDVHITFKYHNNIFETFDFSKYNNILKYSNIDKASKKFSIMIEKGKSYESLGKIYTIIKLLSEWNEDYTKSYVSNFMKNPVNSYFIQNKIHSMEIEKKLNSFLGNVEILFKF